MQIINFLCADGQSRDLSDFAHRVFKTLDVTDGMERDSSNYPEEKYFVGKIDAGRLMVALSDVAGFDDLPYWLSVNTETGSDALAHIEMLIKKMLLTAGIRIAKIENFDKKDMLRVDY